MARSAYTVAISYGRRVRRTALQVIGSPLSLAPAAQSGGATPVSTASHPVLSEPSVRTSPSRLVFAAIATKDERRSLFNLDTFADKPFLVAIGLSLLIIVLTTTLNPLERLLQTGPLELEQWLICIAVALVVPVVAEIRKLLIKTPIDASSPEGDA